MIDIDIIFDIIENVTKGELLIIRFSLQTVTENGNANIFFIKKSKNKYIIEFPNDFYKESVTKLVKAISRELKINEIIN